MPRQLGERTAEGRSRILGQELPEEEEGEEEKSHGGLVNAAKERALAALKKLKVFKPVKAGAPPVKAVVNTCRVLSWKMAEGKKDARAR